MMSGIRTPPQKVSKPSPKKPEVGPSERRSIGDRIEDWEAARAVANAGPTSRNPGTQIARTPPHASTGVEPPRQTKTRTIEARECIARAKLHLGKARNLKTEIKDEVMSALTKLFSLIKGIESELKGLPAENGEKGNTAVLPISDSSATVPEVAPHSAQIEEHARLLRENNLMITELKQEMQAQKQLLEKVTTTTYASVTAKTTAQTDKVPYVRETLHSVVVSSTDDQDSGERVLEKIRDAVDAKEGWVEVRNVRKARDRKVIIGLSSKAERDKLKVKLMAAKEHLTVEEVKNRDPLLVLRGVLNIHKDEDILKALRNQNRDLFSGIEKSEDRVEFRYRRRTRNPHTCHAVISVSPIIWQKALARKLVQIDLQPVKVEDQTPLVQCTRCLGYGHGKRFCTDPADLCSHCGGPHVRTECADFLAGTPPKCKNCERAKFSNAEHNVFDASCPIRKKWDALARSTIAYC
ncbi:uncharacterized protein LOC113505797 [Trichoplusia ni]|uniref:Uncharacterized protein LOC113505797 n=1 Tax=Trichoplusia ni TaxID=7111 RepID=A0A7E5WV69_TRINI|nr:uncharacterized protein LOC113505797 [Trichoplusia ni]